MSYKCAFLYLLIKISIYKVFAAISVTDKGVLPIEKNSVGIRFFVDIVNENHVNTCRIYSRVKKCCLIDLDVEDCSTMNVIDETLAAIKPKDKETLEYVFPTLFPYDLVGYCDFMLKYRCDKNKNKNRLYSHIPFDTRITNAKHPNSLLKYDLGNQNYIACETYDQNSIDNCVPINCDIKYGGTRSFYDTNVNRCTKVPTCVGDVYKELSNIVYVPSINVCKSLEYPLTQQDIYAISTGLGTVTRPIRKDDDLKVELKSNCSTISQNLYLLKDLMYGKLCPCDKSDINYEDGCKSAILSIVYCIISICAILFAFLLCVNTTVWVHNQWSQGNIDAFMVRVKNKLNRPQTDYHVLHSSKSRVKHEVKNNLLREVMVKDIPLELRDSVVSICERMEKKLRTKKRYRNEDIGSQISLQKESARVLASSSSSDSLSSEKDALIK